MESSASLVCDARRRAWLPAAWSALLALLMLGPALGPGYLLVRDMVWVPDLSLGRADVLGWGSALPRAVPSDAVVAVLDEVLGGHWLAILVLLGALVGAGAGAAALVGGSLTGRLVAASVAVWSPFVAERLGIGHWPVLLGYAAVPWLALAGRRIGVGGRWPWWLVPVLAAGSLSANAGLVSGTTVLVTAAAGAIVPATRASVRRLAGLLVVVAAVNAPWVVAGLAHGGVASDPVGFEVFRTGGDALPAPLAALTLGGIWNDAVVPGSRHGVAAWLGLVFLLVLVLAGSRGWVHRLGRRQALAQALLWSLGVGIAVLSAVAPSALATIADVVPAGGLLRDGSRSLAWALPLTVGLVARGSEQLLEVLPRPALVPAVLGLVLIPVALMPDAAWGLAGALRPVDYPVSWTAARAVVGTDHGDAVVLPAGSYRAPVWNGGRPVFDPMGRQLRVSTVVDDDLVVDDVVVPGEDPRVPEVRTALEQPTAQARAGALRAAGIGWVVTELDAAGAAALPDIAGEVVLDSRELRVVRLPGTVTVQRTRPWRVGFQLAAWTAALGALVLGPLVTLLRRRGRDAGRLV